MTKSIYLFKRKNAEGSAEMHELLGGKGANLAEMCNLDLPVPPGFTITTSVCNQYMENGKEFPASLIKDVQSFLSQIEQEMGRKFGCSEDPLLLSVRSGAPVSMPGMMDTILNLGLNDQTLEGLAKQTDNLRFALDSYRRFIQMFSETVEGIKHEFFEERLDELKKESGVNHDFELSEQDLKTLVRQFKEIYQREKSEEFPQDPVVQLQKSIRAVFDSWFNQRAVSYRQYYNIPETYGTAVNVQSMVFGNLGNNSATGVLFSRNPSTGENKLYGEYLPCAQGEDVVAGIRTGMPILLEEELGDDEPSLERSFPEVFKELSNLSSSLENHYKDMQDIEFTVERGKLFLLQCRGGKRSAKAALKIAVDFEASGLINKEKALTMVDPDSLPKLLHPTIAPDAEKELVATGLPASPGAASGKVVFSAQDAKRLAERGEDAILVRIETSPEDIEGMYSAQGILTSRGGMTSHAAVVARGMGKCCVVGCSAINIHYSQGVFESDGLRVEEGDIITLDGNSGEIFLGRVPMVGAQLDENLTPVMNWADELRKLRVFANADNPHDAQMAVKFGAEGIALCRTEHMFFEKERIKTMRELILSYDSAQRKNALATLKPFQMNDFYELFKVLEGRPITVRLLDPPLHEFLPRDEEDLEELAHSLEVPLQTLESSIENLEEFNPMLGHRGCRLGISHPEIYQMQTEAILEAAVKAKKEGFDVKPKIMIPLIAFDKELLFLKNKLSKVVKRVFDESGISFEVPIGTMIELPRACLTADKLAEVADFFSFGTNDLTQTTLGISRDDSARFMKDYISNGLLGNDPFVLLDENGVGQLIQIAHEKSRRVKPDIEMGICGEHGGEPASIKMAHKWKLDYVSCSPFRIPIARLAAAQAAISEK